MKMPSIAPALVSALKKLKLGHIVDTLPERIVLADKQGMPVQELFLLVLSDEITRRETTSTERREKDAGLDMSMQIERWDKTAKVTYDKCVFAELMSLGFLEGLATALGHMACRHRYQVRFTRADEMLRSLRQSRLDNSRGALMMQLSGIRRAKFALHARVQRSYSERPVTVAAKILALICLTSILQRPTPCHAIEPPPVVTAPRGVRLAPELSVAAQSPLVPFGDPKLRKAQRRARLVLTAGVSITGSALIHAIWAGSAKGACSGDPDRRGLHTDSLIAAGVAGAVGISLTFVGGFRLARTKRMATLPMSRKDRALLGVLAVGTAAATQLLLGIVRLADNNFCSS